VSCLHGSCACRFVFTIIGMNVFGGLELDGAVPNFDTLLGSLMISFQGKGIESS
jgi:hypothetical protein